MSRHYSPIRISADSSRVFDALAETALLLRAEGAQWHEALELHEVDGQLSLHCPAPSSPDPLLSVPRPLLIPLSGLQWHNTAALLQLRASPDGLSPIQEDLLGLMLELLNHTGKLSGWFASSPRVLAFRDPPILAALRRLRPRLWSSGSASIPDAFLATRRLRVVGAQGASEERYLLPLVDLANHHPLAPAFHLAGGHLHLYRSEAVDSDELFVDYGGSRDCLDIALHYAYVDPAVRYAFSAPLRFEAPQLGPVVIQGRPLERCRLGDAPILSFEKREDGAWATVVSHFCFSSSHAQGLLPALTEEVQRHAEARSLGLSSEQAGQAAAGLIAEVAARNGRLLEEVAALCARTPLRCPAADVLASAALAQAEIIRSVQHSVQSAVTPSIRSSIS